MLTCRIDRFCMYIYVCIMYIFLFNARNIQTVSNTLSGFNDSKAQRNFGYFRFELKYQFEKITYGTPKMSSKQSKP